jgi:hypothetical protein
LLASANPPPVSTIKPEKPNTLVRADLQNGQATLQPGLLVDHQVCPAPAGSRQWWRAKGQSPPRMIASGPKPAALR